MPNMKGIYLAALLLCTGIPGTLNQNSEYEFEAGNERTKVLSRKKRFLIFPDGSSFQMVFCTQTSGYLQLDNVVWFGNTAALAWQLPTDPSVIRTFKDATQLGGNRRTDQPQKHIYLIDEKGKVLGKRPYARRPIVNPAFAKRSVDDVLKEDLNKTSMHDRSKMRGSVKLENSEFHRDGRFKLYEKVEKLMDGLGWSGEDCILRMLCEAGRHRPTQGSFLHEIIKAVFTLPKGQVSSDARHGKYDDAHQEKGKCSEKYFKCVNKFTGEPLYE